MSTAKTLAPSAMNRSAIALPIPEPVPVTNATLPCNLPVMTTLLCSIVIDVPGYAPFLICSVQFASQFISASIAAASRGACRQSQHVTHSGDLLSRFANDHTTSLFFSVYAPPIGIAQYLRIAMSQGFVQTLRARFRARIQVRQVG